MSDNNSILVQRRFLQSTRRNGTGLRKSCWLQCRELWTVAYDQAARMPRRMAIRNVYKMLEVFHYSSIHNFAQSAMFYSIFWFLSENGPP